VALGKDLARAV